MSNRMMIAALVASVAAFLVSAPPSLAQPVLTLEGSCPGPMRADVSGARPGGGVILLFASETGSFTIPWYLQCGGTQLGLGRYHLRYVASTASNQNGFAFFEAISGSQSCGGYLQIHTSQSGGCETSNVVRID